MRGFLKTSIWLAIGIAGVLTGCDDSGISTEKVQANAQSEKIQEKKNVTQQEFAKSLALAMKEVSVRQLLKDAALEKFDGDFDILYSFIKDRKLPDGRTFKQVLSAYADQPTVDHWEVDFPLLTIFVPDLESFSASDWNVNSEIPAVAIYSTEQKEKVSVINQDLNRYELSTTVQPKTPIVVLKENERLVAKQKNNASRTLSAPSQSITATEEFFQDQQHTYYFIGDVKSQKHSNERFSSAADMATFNSNGYFNNVSSQRDWTYYYIAPNLGYNSGTLNTSYIEKIRGFKLANSSVLQNVSGNWTEGLLEFHIYLVRKFRSQNTNWGFYEFSCSPSQLASGTTMLDYKTDIPLSKWDLYDSGSNWRFYVYEYDPGTSVSTTFTISSNFGVNQTGSYATKTGIGIGGNSFQLSGTISADISQASNYLGTETIWFQDPIILTGSIGLDPSKPSAYSFQTKTVNTGAVELSVEPVQVAPDSRPVYEP